MTALPAEAPVRWSLPRRFAFRFLFVYLVLYNLPWPLGWLPGTGAVARAYESTSNWLLAWFGASVLGVERDLAPFPTGSGDTTRHFVELELQSSLALLATAGWSLGDRRLAHARLADLLRTYVRYVLASALLGYGTAKWFSGQFPPLDIERLQSTWGDCSPMGVVWRFMGSSQVYTAFSGVVECLGGLLLLWRRTATLGGLLAAVAMTNVVLINFCYDVPVKLYSSHLLLMAIVVLWRDLPRLGALLLWNLPAPAAALRLPAPSRWFGFVRVAKVAVVLLLLGRTCFGLVGRAQQEHEVGPLDGCYDVVAIERDGVAVPRLLDDAGCWKRWSCRWGRCSIERHGSAEAEYFVVELDEERRQVTMRRIRSPDAADDRPDVVMTWRDEIATPMVAAVDAVAQPAVAAPAAATAGRRLVLEGDCDGARLTVHLHEPAMDSFLLQNRGFHWIQEYPYNR